MTNSITLSYIPKIMKAVVIVCFSFISAYGQLAVGKSKYLGNVTGSSIPANFDTYWNQITPENASKWGSVEATRDVMNWTQLDLAYNKAKTMGYPFKFHTLIWGSQYPSWITSLSAADQKIEIEEWYAAVAARYPAIDWIDVVNEPIKTACPFKGSLGGDGSTGWDWVIESFRLARQYFPTAKLFINEYGTENDPPVRTTYKNIINLLKTRGYIDGIGVQSHHFNLDNMSAAQMTTMLDDYATLGIDVHISELDIIGGSETGQRNKYQELFPIMWNHASVKGVTLWGYIEGSTWRAGTGILNSNGTERLAMQWLKTFMTGATNTLTTSTASVSFTNVASTSSAISVTSNISWTITDNQTWITTSATSGSNNGTFTISATANTSTTARSGSVTVSGGGITRTISVNQSGAPVSNNLTLSSSSVSLAATASTSSAISITSNVSWTITDDQTWITTSSASGSNNGSFTISATANTGTTARSGTITVSGGGITRTVAVSQAAPASGSRTFTVRARGTSSGAQLQLRVNGTLVTTWNLTTTLANYTATSTLAGTVRVQFANDATNRDIQVDYLQVNSTTYQAEAQAVNTAYYANGRCGGGGNNEMMHCNGYIEFAGSSASRVGSAVVTQAPTNLDDISVYPNPSTKGDVTIKLRSENSNINMYDITGKHVQSVQAVDQKEVSLNMNLNAGVYVVEIVDEYGREIKKLIVQ
jgi:endo-1,4-beta-xylanase